jgi:predicted 3-demethylubiquinone-9 3-methyltransferase (glyoxalase superfamily)
MRRLSRHFNEEHVMAQKITPWLWFDGNAEEAMNFYVSVFKDAEAVEVTRFPEDSPMPAGTMTVSFKLFGLEFAGLNGGPDFTFNESISFQIDCEDQAEVDYYWTSLTADGGEESMCGWLKDKFGVSWQVTPRQLGELMSDPDPAKANAVTQAMLQMRKLEVAKLQAAYDSA